jgi:hypothetical protein
VNAPFLLQPVNRPEEGAVHEKLVVTCPPEISPAEM